MNKYKKGGGLIVSLYPGKLDSLSQSLQAPHNSYNWHNSYYMIWTYIFMNCNLVWWGVCHLLNYVTWTRVVYFWIIFFKPFTKKKSHEPK